MNQEDGKNWGVIGAEEHARLISAAADRDRLHAALREATNQLEGWIRWKCPKRHVPEHLENLARLQAAL